MDSDSAVWIDPNSDSSPQCLHKRLLEKVLDSHGNKTDFMRCCECGALMPPKHRQASLQ